MAAPDAVTDLLGALAYGELSAFDHLADDAGLAPSLAGRAEMSALAAEEFGHYRQLAERLRELGAQPEDAMAPFVAALETYHSLTKPSTWLEGVVKATDAQTGYITISIGSDSGLSKGDTLEVYRLRPDPAYLGIVEVIAVRADQAVAKPASRVRSVIQVGDRVSSNVVTKR